MLPPQRFMQNIHSDNAFRKLRKVELESPDTFAAIAEEKSITAEQGRCCLSQPAGARLAASPSMFQDDLLVRRRKVSELICEAARFFRRWRICCQDGESGHAESVRSDAEEKHFRISGPDNVCTVVLPRLRRQYGTGYQVQFEFLPWQAVFRIWWNVANSILFFTLMTGSAVPFHTERLYRQDWVCGSP